MTNQTRPAAKPSPDNRGETPKAPPFIETREVRRVPLGNLKTEEEARLAAEIEKLRE